MKRIPILALFAASCFAQGNPVVRMSYVVPFNSQSATGTATSSAIRIPNLAGYGTLTITGSGITGSPSGCQIALQMEQSTGAPASSAFATQAFTPGNSYQSFAIGPSSVVYSSGDALIAVYSCSGYPSGGTITVTFDPISAAAIVGAVAVTGTFWQSTQPVSIAGSVAVTGTFWQATQPVSGTFWQATQPVSGTFWQATQPVNNAGTFAVQSTLQAGSALAGKFGIDQTTPGTTNAVQANAGTNLNTSALATSANQPYQDPCGLNAWTYYPVNISSNTQIAAAVAATYYYVCEAIFPNQAGAVNVQLVEGTGTVCATSTAGLMGGATAALGANIAANGGFIAGFPGGRAVAASATANQEFCIYASASVNGVIAYVASTTAP